MTSIEKVRQIIIEFKKQGRSSLNLGFLGLTSEDLVKLLPIIAKELPNLQWLILEGNEITFLPKSIGKLSNLIELNINNNNLKYLPISTGNLIKLSWLHATNNTIKNIPSSLLSLPNLSMVDFSENPLCLKSLLDISKINNYQAIFSLSQKQREMLEQELNQSFDSKPLDQTNVSVATFTSTSNAVEHYHNNYCLEAQPNSLKRARPNQENDDLDDKKSAPKLRSRTDSINELANTLHSLSFKVTKNNDESRKLKKRASTPKNQNKKKRVKLPKNK